MEGQLHMRLDDILHDQLKVEAVVRGTNVADMVRGILADWIEKEGGRTAKAIAKERAPVSAGDIAS